MKKRYPVKQDLNLALYDEAHRRRARRTALLIVVIVLLVAALCKFAVADRFIAARNAQTNAAAAEERVEKIRTQNTRFDEVQAQYDFISAAREAVDYEIDPLDALLLLEEYLIGDAEVSSLLVDKSVISVQFSGLTLGEISTVYSTMLTHELVESIQVFTASTDTEPGPTSSEGDVIATMTIHLTAEKEEGSAP